MPVWLGREGRKVTGKSRLNGVRFVIDPRSPAPTIGRGEHEQIVRV